MPTQTCQSCRHWRNSPGSAQSRTGVCSKPEFASGFTGWRRTEATDSCGDWAEVAYYRSQDGAMHVDRRASARTGADYPARLQTAGGDWSGRLTDISATGARMQVRNPPKRGAHALLRCGANEVFCKIAWSGDDACGLAFDRPVSHSLVFEIGGKVAEPSQSAADPAKIPAGKKRPRLEHSSLGQARFDAPGDDRAPRKNVVSLDERRPAPNGSAPAGSSFESRDADGYIKFYPFRAGANR